MIASANRDLADNRRIGMGSDEFEHLLRLLQLSHSRAKRRRAVRGRTKPRHCGWFDYSQDYRRMEVYVNVDLGTQYE